MDIWVFSETFPFRREDYAFMYLSMLMIDRIVYDGIPVLAGRLWEYECIFMFFRKLPILAGGLSFGWNFLFLQETVYGMRYVIK